MTSRLRHPMAEKSILETLVKHQLVTKNQAREILFKSDSLKKRLETSRQRRLKDEKFDVFPNIDQITLLDVLTDKSLHRIGDTFKGLDEEVLYQTLANEWGIPYQTIDPLKLDLNLVTATIPLKRGGAPNDVAGAVLFLVSDLADFITGEVTEINGGAWFK